MSTRKLSRLSAVTARFAVALLLATLSLGCGTTPDDGSGAPRSNAAPASAGQPQEGIKVHGHWTIEVREPDGTLASRREFDNALRPDSGVATLLKILTRSDSVGLWQIRLSGQQDIFLVESNASVTPGPDSFKTLTVTAPTSGPNAGKVVLEGTATASVNNQITRVFTDVNLCVPSAAPVSPCTTVGITRLLNPFTDTTLTEAVSATARQQILVTVTIGFS